MRRHLFVSVALLAVCVGITAPILFPPVRADVSYKILIASGTNAWVEVYNMKVYASDDCSGTPLVCDPPLHDFLAKCGGCDHQMTNVPEAAKSVKYDVYVYKVNDAPLPCESRGTLKKSQLNYCAKLPHRKVWASEGEPQRPIGETGGVVIQGPVGGTIIPIDKLSLLAPYAALATIVVAITVGAAYARKHWSGKAAIR